MTAGGGQQKRRAVAAVPNVDGGAGGDEAIDDPGESLRGGDMKSGAAGFVHGLDIDPRGEKRLDPTDVEPGHGVVQRPGAPRHGPEDADQRREPYPSHDGHPLSVVGPVDRPTLQTARLGIRLAPGPGNHSR